MLTPCASPWSGHRDTKRHVPKHEVWVGVPTPGTELPERVDAILRAVETHPLHEATPHDDRFLEAVHDRELLDFLAGAADAWAAGPYDELVGQDRVVPYFFQTEALLAGMAPSPPAALHARAGQFCYDTMTLVGPGTWEAARAAVDVALTAVDLVLAGERAAYALCRPPGHHVTPLGYGGSCYLNNAAVAAEALRAAGHERVAVIDIDAHHGNGTQAVFWERADVCYGSLHVDPAAGWFPHVFGHAGETGAGAGDGCDAQHAAARRAPATSPGWRRSRELADWAAAAARRWSSRSAWTPPATTRRARCRSPRTGSAPPAGCSAASGLPSVLVQEGGYHLETMGSLVAAYLAGHAG